MIDDSRHPNKIYVASKTHHGLMWRNLASEKRYGFSSTWIYEADKGETKSMSELWARILDEIKGSCALVVFVDLSEPTDLPLKRALVEVGMALACGLNVFVAVSYDGSDVPSEDLTKGNKTALSALGSWLNHPNVLALKGSDALERCLELANVPVGSTRVIDKPEEGDINSVVHYQNLNTVEGLPRTMEVCDVEKLYGITFAPSRATLNGKELIRDVLGVEFSYETIWHQAHLLYPSSVPRPSSALTGTLIVTCEAHTKHGSTVTRLRPLDRIVITAGMKITVMVVKP